jgi:hypothetical protein
MAEMSLNTFNNQEDEDESDTLPLRTEPEELSEPFGF